MEGNFLEIKSLGNFYKGRTRFWYDPDELMLHAPFQILVDFIEKEKPWHLVPIDDNEMNAQGKLKERAMRLYNYWKKGRKRLVGQVALATKMFNKSVKSRPAPNRIVGKESWRASTLTFSKDSKRLLKRLKAMEAMLLNTDQAALHELVEIRPKLWN